MYLEHANITVPNIDAATRFLRTAFPDFRIRGGGQREDGLWQHVGNDKTYIALQQENDPQPDPRIRYVHDGVHHLGVVVEDVLALERRLLDAGYRQNPMGEDHPARLRRYFFDDAGMEWEFVEYLTDEVDARNQY